MPTIKTIDGVQIKLFFYDHNPPHVHCEQAGSVMKVNFDGTIISGKIAKNKQEIILSWIKNNKNFLNEKWKEFGGK